MTETLEALIVLIGSVETMSGDPLTEVLAPSEIRAIAETVVSTNILVGSGQSGLPAHLAWMTTVPAHMHDCFSA
jgi:hypothetical protein